MEIKAINDGKDIKILLDPYQIMHEVMNGEQRSLLIQSLSCADDIINHVIQHVLFGFTDDGYSGSWCDSMDTAIQKARKTIAENSGDAVKSTINDFESKVKSQASMIDFLNAQIEKLKYPSH